MLSAIIIAKTIAGLSVGPAVKRQLSDCVFYKQQYISRPVLFKRFESCYKELVDAKFSRMREGNEQAVRQSIRTSQRDSTVVKRTLANIRTKRTGQAGVVDTGVYAAREL